MIKLIKNNDGKYFLKITEFVSSTTFQEILKIYRQFGVVYDAKVSASYHKNPKVLLDCLDELADNFEVSISPALREEIENINPFQPSFKPKRRKLNQDFFEKYPALGEFQKEDVYKMFCLGRCLNANKMGLGKTYETIQTTNHLIDSENVSSILIVAISPVLYNWKRELLNFSPFFNKEDILIVNKDNRDFFFKLEKYPKVILMSYNTLKLVSDFHYKEANPKSKVKNYKSCQIPFDAWLKTKAVIVLDEAHKIKNMSTRWTQIVHQIKEKFEYRYCLTGTPHPNHVGELYSLIKFLDDDLIEANYSEFIKTIAIIGNKYSDYAIDSIIDYKANLFQERIKPYVIRRFLRDHIELPQVFNKDIFIELTGQQKYLYQALVNEALLKIKQEKGKIAFRDIQSKFPYIIQFLADPCLLKDKLLSVEGELPEKIEKWKFEEGLKYKACESLVEELLSENKEQKIVIWSEYPKTIDNLTKAFEKYGVIAVHGQNTPKDRDKDEWRDYITQEVFKKDKNKRILIANPATLGTGTNLQFVSHVITHDEGFSFVDKDQKKSRFERFGMKGEVTYWKLIIDDSLDCYVDTVLKNKELQDRLFLKEGLAISDLQSIFLNTKK